MNTRINVNVDTRSQRIRLEMAYNSYEDPFFKTRICDAWVTGRCSVDRSKCRYAHGEMDRRIVPPKPCHAMRDTGYCPYGSTCFFKASHNLLLHAPSTKPIYPSYTVLNSAIPPTPLVKVADDPPQSIQDFLHDFNCIDARTVKPTARSCYVCMARMHAQTVHHCNVLVPCGHAVVCGLCAPRLQHCPVCNTKASSHINLLLK